MKKLLSVVLALAIVASCFTMITIFAGETTKTVVNGDAESTGGWMNSHLGNGTTTIIEEPGNETNHVAMATIGGQYETIGYDFSPAIIQDAAKNLAGGGAGVYNVSFRYKAAEAGKTGKFNVTLASAWHGQKSNVTTLLGTDAYAQDTYFAMQPQSITMTDQWQTYEGTVVVSEAYLAMLKACEAKGKANAQTLTIRLDGASGAFASSTFNYYVDDMTIEKQAEPKGIKVEVTEDFVGDGAYTYVRTTSTGLTKEMAVDGKIVKNFVIYNTSDVAIKIEAMYQNDWSNVSGVSSVVHNDEIPAGEKKTFTLTVPCNASGMVTDTVALDALTLRFNVRAASGSLKAGNAVIISAEGNKEIATIGAANRQGGTAGKAKASAVMTLPNTIVGYAIEKTGTDTTTYGTTGTNGGSYTTADIKGGKLEKTYTIYNTNDYEVNVGFALQATVAKKTSGYAWAGRTASVNIPAKSSAEVTAYLAEGTTAGKVIIPENSDVNEQEVDVTKVFIRLDIKKGNTIEKGTKVIFEAKENDPISKFAGTGWTTTAVTELPAKTTPTPTATATPIPTPVPVVKGLKLVGTTKLLSSTGTAAKYPTTAFAFTAEDILWDDASTGDGTEYTKKSGTITRVYDVYNDGTVPFRAGVTVYGGNRLANGTSAVVGWDLPTGTKGHVSHETEALAAQSVRTQTIVIPVYQLQDGTIVIKDKKSAMEIGGTNVTGYAPLNTLRLRVDFWDFEVGASMIIAPQVADEDDIIYTLADTSSYATKTLVYELPNIVGTTPTPTETPTPTPIIIKEVVNGDAENGNTAWGAILGGSTTIVADPTDATNKVAKFVPSGQYHTVSFDLGPAIIQDAANGYYGGGAGTYEITFRAKAEEGKGGKFGGFVNSQWHQSKGATIGDYTLTANTYLNTANGFDMTDAWGTYTMSVNITEAWLNNLYAAAAKADATTLAKIYNLTLRLDGSSKAFKLDGANNYFTYYVDDVVIAKLPDTTTTAPATTEPASTEPVTPTPTTTAPATDYVGMKFEVTQAVTSGYLYFRNGSAGITASEIVDGKLTKTFEVYNMNDYDVPVTIYYQNGWSSISGTTQGKATVAPKSKAIITTVVPVADSLDPAALSLRVDLGQGGIELPVGTSIIIAGEPGDEIFGIGKNAGKTGDGAGVSSGVTELPAYTVPTPTPIAQKVLSNGDAENGKTNWMANMGGTVNVIDDADKAGNHIVEFVPDTSQYSTVNFDLGPAIVKNEANGYNGGGAGKYIVTFRAKAEAGKGGNFSFVLNSKMHKNMNDNVNGYKATENTYLTFAGFAMTDEWQTYTITVNVTDSFLQNINNCFDASKSDDVFKLCLRFDGSGSKRAFGSGTFKYYVDDVTIEMAAPATPEPTPVGIQFESTEVISSDHYVISGEKVLANEPDFTGKKTVSYTFYNNGKQKAYIYFGFQVTHTKADGKATWADAGKGQSMTILPERKVTLTAEVDVKNGLVTVTNGGTTTAYPLEKLFYRINFQFPGTNETGNTVIIGGNSETDLIYNIKSGYKLIASKVGELPDYIEASKADTAPKKENGNVENGLVNWGNIHGGKIEQVQPGAAGTGNAAKLVVSGTGKYQSLAFDLGPWIIYDKEEGYAGGGPGKYEVTFYAKGTKSGKFNVMLNSQLHLDQKGVAKEIGSGAAVNSTWLGGGSIDMTKGWKKYTVTFDVKADWYKQMLRLYDSNNAKAAMAYQLALRFDGANGAFKNGPFSYMVDQVSVKKVASYSLATVTGVELELKEDTEGATYLKTGTGIVNSSMIKDDQITKEFEITNTGTEPINIYFTLQATVTSNGKAAWVAPNAGETITIEPGETETVSFTMDVNKDKTVTVGDEDVKLDKFFARFDLKNEDNGTDLVAGTKFKIVAIDKADYKAISQLTSSKAKSWTITPVYSKSTKTETGDALPVAMIAAATFAFVGLAVVVVKKKRRED